MASVAGGGLLSLLSHIGFEGLAVYRRYFLIIIGLLVVFLAVLTRLESDRDN